jgi:hypothetical protein
MLSKIRGIKALPSSAHRDELPENVIIPQNGLPCRHNFRYFRYLVTDVPPLLGALPETRLWFFSGFIAH